LMILDIVSQNGQTFGNYYSFTAPGVNK